MTITSTASLLNATLSSVGSRTECATPSTDDAALMEAVRNGDSRAFATIVQRYHVVLYRVAWRTLLEEEAARDVVQEVFVKLWQRPTWLRDGGASLRTWLCRITLNASIDARRRRRPTEVLPTEDVAAEPSGGGHDEQLFAEWRRQLVHRLVAELPDHWRNVLLLCYFEELSHREAAGVLGISTKAVESRLARARRALRDRLARHGLSGMAGLA